MKKIKWKLKKYDDIDYTDINPGLLLRDMLIDRGIENPEAWLNVSKENENSTSLLSKIDEAVALINEALANEWRIYLQVDS